MRDSAGNIYGGTQYGSGNSTDGVIYKVTPDGTVTTFHQFCSEPNCADGGNPWGGLILGSDGNIWGTTLGTVFKLTLAGDLTTVYSFCSLPDCADGQGIYVPLVEGRDGNFYGVAQSGGFYRFEVCGGGCGTVFKLTPAGVLTTLHDFNGYDGYYPYTDLCRALTAVSTGPPPGEGRMGLAWHSKFPPPALLPCCTVLASSKAITSR